MLDKHMNTMKDYLSNQQMPNLWQILTIIVAILAMYVSLRLTPLEGADTIQTQRIQAIEKDYARQSYVEKGFADISKKLDRMETKLDKLTGY